MSARRVAAGAVGLAAAPLAAASAYQLVLLAAGWHALRRRPAPTGGGPPQLPVTVVIPAHDEEAVLGRTLDALAAADFPPELLRVLVIADNCTDRTAAIAHAAGATVWERVDRQARGKGRALAWALERLFAEPDQRGFVVFIDADCAVSPNLLREVEQALRGGAAAVQTAHVVANPEASPVAALRYAGFRLMMTLRPAALDALGLSAGLHGTGMGFRRDVLRELGWRSYSITEDLEQHLGLVERGHRVAFLAQAEVASPAPLTHSDAASQQERWEGGRFGLASRVAPAAAARAARRGDVRLVMAAAEIMTPPQSLQGAGNLGLLAAAAALRSRPLLVVAAAGLGAQALYVLGGLAAVRAPAPVWRALLQAPVLVARKLGVFGRVAGGNAPAEFVRTHRDATPGAPAPAEA